MRRNQKAGCGCGPLVFVGFAIFALVLVFVIAPMTEKYKTLPAQPGWYGQLEQQVQKMVPWSHQSTPAKKSGTTKQTSNLSGSCLDMARQAAQQAGIDPNLFVKQINQESGCQASVCSSAHELRNEVELLANLRKMCLLDEEVTTHSHQGDQHEQYCRWIRHRPDLLPIGALNSTLVRRSRTARPVPSEARYSFHHR